MKAKTPTRPPWRQIARPEQILPAGDWDTWLILAGRGYGKTRTGAETVREWSAANPRIGIIAPTFADARDICIEGESGLKSICEANEITKWNRSMGEGEFKNGAKFKCFSADEPDRLRGPQHYKLWCDELASWSYQRAAWDMALFGLRLGAHPQAVITTTPRPTPVIREILARPNVHITRGSTYDNRANLAETFFNQIIQRYEGTRLGRQEINAEILEDAAGALWHRDNLEKLRVSAMPPLTRIVVAVDPSATSAGDECGIVAAGKSEDGQGYLLEDASLRASPDKWAAAAVACYHRHHADRMIAESNQGGEMVSLTIGTVMGAPPVTLIHASRGKQARAEPVSALYDQGKVHHVGYFPQLEDEFCSWEPSTNAASPNRLDAAVYALTELLIGGMDGLPISFG